MVFKKNKRYMLFARLGVIVFLLPKMAISQNGADNPLTKVSIASPGAAAIAKYGDYQVGHQTGTPQISIPIYTLKEGPLSFPVSLSYHASGLKVQEAASSVGAGWSLSAGGVITRTVRGNVDERGFGAVSTQTHGHLSDMGYNNYLFTIQAPHLCTSIGNAATEPNDMNPEDGEFTNGKRDGEPDLFTFNFNGYAGKFFFNDDRTPVLVPEQDLKIETNPLVAPFVLSTFIITTPDGVKYYFGQNQSNGNGGVNAVEVTGSCDANVGLSFGSAYSSWYLVKIVSPDNLFSISLKYDAEKYSSYTISTKALELGEQVQKEFSLVKNYMNGVRLSKISGSNVEVLFNPGELRSDLSNYNPALNSMADDPNTEAKTLGEIKIQGATGNEAVCKKFKFTYSYFEDNTTPFPAELFAAATNSDRKRLKLDKLQLFSCDETQNTPPHVFDYYPEPVSRSVSFAQDHWGFYNGSISNSTLIPTYTVNTHTYKFGADRESKWPEMRGGALKKIIYPTGGYTDFDFEPNTTWVNAPRQNLVTVGWYSVGYDGNGTAIYSGLNLTTNTYRITITNNACLAGYTCGAAVYLESNDGTVSYGQIVYTPGASTQTAVFTPTAAGVYRLRLSRDNTIQSGSGATATLQEIVPYQLQSNVTVGGLRIKKITNYDGVSTADNVVTNYTYDDQNNKSNGVLYSKPVYVGILRNDILKTHIYPECSPNGCFWCDAGAPPAFKTPATLRPLETIQGSHIGYKEVKVSKTGNGASVYRYYGSDIWDLNVSDVCTRNVNHTAAGCDLSTPNYPAAPLPFEYLRGELKYEGHFNETGQLLKYDWYYPTFADNALKTPGYITASLLPGTMATNYFITTKRKTQMVVDATSIDPQTSISQNSVTTTYFESPYHKQATRTVATNSKGETLETKYNYAFDFRLSTCDGAPNCLQTYQTAATIALNTYNTALFNAVNTPGCNQKLTAYHQYRRDLSEARKTYLNCQTTNKTNFNSCLQTATTNANADLKPILQLQAKNINAPIEVTTWKNGNLLGATFTKYENAVTPVDMAYPGKVQAINLAATSATFTPAATNGTNNGIIKDSRYKDETTAKFYNGNLAEITGKDGVTTSYLWEHNNVLPVAKSIGVNHTTLLNAYATVGGTIANIPQLRTHATLSAAQLNTYEYIPAIGMVKETDVNGKSITYEYDKLHRLLLARDFNNNIIKQYDYKYQANVPNTTPQWVATGNSRCEPCPANPIYTTGNFQIEEQDNNPYSPTYNTLRYVNSNTIGCVIQPDWQDIGGPFCLNGSNGGGPLYQRKIDINPCSVSYNSVMLFDTNIQGGCGGQQIVCNGITCTGDDKKCVNNICETGTIVYTAAVYKPLAGLWSCVYHYLWSDGSISPDYNTSSPTSCL
jgi:hypothetical protein